jgi:hypothetical protein
MVSGDDSTAGRTVWGIMCFYKFHPKYFKRQR